MSSSSNRPYKSRFFNFLNRYSIRLKDQAGVAWRNAAQTTVEWGVQILLYPVYLVVQAGRFAQRQLKQTVRNVPRLIASRFKKDPTAQPVDLLLPTERVLDVLPPTVSCSQTTLGDQFPRLDVDLIHPTNPFSGQEPSSLAISETSDSSLVANSFKIQGIVSLIDDHRLAVVTSENIVLDILTLEQQKTLDAFIRLELANYWYEKRLRSKAQRKTPGLMPSFRKSWPNVLPPVRWFWQIMRWEQTSDIAKEINLFGESSLVPIEPLPSELMPPPILTRLDEKLAVIEEKDLISLTHWLQQSLMQSHDDLSESPTWKVQALIRAAVHYFFSSKQSEISASEQPLTIPGTASGQKILESVKETGAYWLYTIGDRINNHLPDTTTNPESDPFKIQVLIKSALSYYLAQEEPLLTPQDAPPILAVSSEATEQDPWLIWQDLFTPTAEITQSSIEPPLQPITALPSAFAIPTKLNNSVQPKIQQQKTPKAIQKVAPKPQSIAPVAVRSTPVEAKRPQSINQSFPTSYKSDKEPDWPDWVEIKATPTGYEKHILERILDGFDQIILWLEELFIKVWHWLRLKKRNRKRNQR